MKKYLLSVLIGLFAIHAHASLVLDFQPVSVCSDDGSNCVSPAFNSSALQQFWQSQAGITLNILDTRQLNNTAAKTMESTSEITNFLFANPHPDPSAPGLSNGTPTLWFSLTSTNFLPAQIALVNGPRGWVDSKFSEEINTVFTAQAIGVMLGLSHLGSTFDTSQNLMKRTIVLDQEVLGNLSLFDEQKTLVLESRFLYEGPSNDVPEPNSVALLGLALIGLAGLRKKSQHWQPRSSLR